VQCLFGALLTALTFSATALPSGPADANWPEPVAHFIERSANCLHFAGEFGGDGSARDAEVNHAMDKLRCNSLAADLRLLRKRYRADARVTARLVRFDADGLPTDPDFSD